MLDQEKNRNLINYKKSLFIIMPIIGVLALCLTSNHFDSSEAFNPIKVFFSDHLLEAIFFLVFIPGLLLGSVCKIIDLVICYKNYVFAFILQNFVPNFSM